jgi:hypothetical protein
MTTSDVPPEGTSEVPPQHTSEASPNGKTRFDWTIVFILLGVAYALAIRAVSIRLVGRSPETAIIHNRAVAAPYCISPLIVFGATVALAAVGLPVYLLARQRQGRLTLWQWCSLLVGVSLPFVAFLAYGSAWHLYFNSYKFGF